MFPLILTGVAILAVGLAVALTRAARRGLVHHYERSAGLRPELIALLDWWADSGPFPIVILPDGGVRTDADVARINAEKPGASNARNARETPHGRAAAMDLARARLSASGRTVIGISQARADYEAIGQIAEQRGLEWGGRWRNQFGFGPDGDGPHVQIHGWRSLPMPGASGVPVA